MTVDLIGLSLTGVSRNQRPLWLWLFSTTKCSLVFRKVPSRLVRDFGVGELEGRNSKPLETDCLNGWKARSTRTRLRLGPAELPSSMAEEISGFLTRARATGGASRRACDMVSDY